MRGSVAAAACAVALACGGTARAAEPGDSAEPTEEETLVVTGTHRPLPESRFPGSVHTIEGRELELRQLDGALDALRHVPGLHADQPGVRGSRASIYTRGLDPSLTQVLVDGIILNDVTNARGGSFDFATLGSDAIDRIEIARGGLSSVYGSDAIAGAVQVITRDGRGDDRASVEGRGGRFGTRLLRASAGGQRGPIDLALSFSYVDEDEPENLGSYAGTALHAKLGFALGEDARLQWVLRTTESRSLAFPEFSGGPRFAVLRGFEERDVQDLASGFTLSAALGESLRAELRAQAYLRREDRRSPGVAPSGPTAFGVPAEPDTADRLQRYDGLARLSVDGPFGLSASAGGSVRYEEGQSRGEDTVFLVPFPLTRPVAFTFDRVVGGPFVELDWSAPFLQLSAGARFDATTEGESEWSPRAGYRLAVHELIAELAPDSPPASALTDVELDLRGSYGEGFKLPAFFALANPTAGNPNLETETSVGFDSGIEARFLGGRVDASATYFFLAVDELIDFDLTTFRLENVGRVRSRGVELALRLEPWDGITLEGHATYVDQNVELRNRPTWRGGFTLAWDPTERFHARLTTLFVDDVRDASEPTGEVNLGNYARVDVAFESARTRMPR